MSTATAAQFHNAQAIAAEQERTALPLRSDTFLGVCEAIGQDLGINPNWIRVVFAPLILINPVAAIGAYLGLGGVVAVARWLFPAKLPEEAAHSARQDDQQEEERLAA